MTQEEYCSLRAERNILRDRFNQSTCRSEYGKLRNEIKEMDKLLTKYEQSNEDYELHFTQTLSRIA